MQKSGKIEMSKLAKMIMIIAIFSKLQSRLEAPFFDDNIIILLCGVGLFLVWIVFSFRIKRRVIILISILAVYASLFTFVFTNKSLETYTRSYFLAYMGYVLIVFSSGCIFSNNKSKISAWSIIKSIYMLVSAFLIVFYLLNFDYFLVLRNPRVLLDSHVGRLRSNFGFVTPNSAAGLCLIGLMLERFVSQAQNNGILKYNTVEKNYIKLSRVTLIIMLVSTACRGAIIALIVSYGVEYYQNITNSVDRKSRILKKIIICGIIVVSAYLVYDYFILSGLVDINYRLYNFTTNIPTLIEKNKLLLGWGFVDKAIFSRGHIIQGTGYTDNYYLYVLVSTGIVGCLIMGLYLVLLINSIHTKRKQIFNPIENDAYKLVVVLLFAILTFSMTEASFINPSSIVSISCMMIFVMFINGGFNTKTN